MPDIHTASSPSRRRIRSSLTEAASVTWLPWLTCRFIVFGALALARYLVSHFQLEGDPAGRVSHAGLLAWDAGWYASIAAHGYHPVAPSGLRFFPLFPVLISAVHHVTFVTVAVSGEILSNGFAFLATMGIYVLARSELGEVGVARSAVWLLSLAPAAFTTVMGYSDALLILLSAACFLALRRRWWFAAAAFGFFAGLARPLGCVLLVPALIEASRGVVWSEGPRLRPGRLGTRELVGRLVAVAAPVAGLVTFLGWTAAVFGSFTKPLTIQEGSSRHGRLTDPLVTMYHDVVSVLHGHHVGTALHVPWVLVSIVLVIVAFRVLPASYGFFSLAILGVAATGTNLDSFERYALSAFPLLIAAATLVRSRRIETTVLVLSASCMFGYALLAFLGAYVP
ncbi:MAG: hypothetical protein ACYDDZ_15405 [Acidimicrobiales bacterium]